MNFVSFCKWLLDSVKPRMCLLKNILGISVAFVVFLVASVCVANLVMTEVNEQYRVGISRRDLHTSGVFDSACNATLYPDVCVSTLLGHPESTKAGNSKKIATIVVKVTIDELKNLSEALAFMSSKLTVGQSNKSAVDDCIELFGFSFRQLNESLGSLQSSEWRRQEADDVQTWLSAALTNQETCIQGVNGNISENPMLPALQKVSNLLSNSLAMVNTISPPRVHRRLSTDSGISSAGESLPVEEGFPSWLSPADRRLLEAPAVGNGIRADAVVAKDGSGNYKTITEAVNAAPSRSNSRYVIHVKAGTYAERVQVSKDGIMLVGDGMYATVVTGSLSGFTPLISISNFVATGKEFVARDMGFENTAGPGKGQAIALLVASDHSALYRCSIRGYQDTLYAYTQRQFYRECDIYGSVDFIFGNAVAVFQSCNIVALKGNGDVSFITAHGRMDPNQNTGFSIHNCRVTTGDKIPVPTYLGRPWMQYSRTVFMQSYLDKSIAPAGWYEWSGNFALKTLYYGEYMNSGPGSTTANRVKWPGHHVITSATEASEFTVQHFISGNSWLPSTGVAFQAGLSTTS